MTARLRFIIPFLFLSPLLLQLSSVFKGQSWLQWQWLQSIIGIVVIGVIVVVIGVGVHIVTFARFILTAYGSSHRSFL